MYLGHYPGLLLTDLVPGVSPFVRLEVGSARVAPHARRDLSSFVHEHLSQMGPTGRFDDNRPRHVRCIHPLLTLFEKLDAIGRRCEREALEPASFVRHYEDAARIGQALERLPDAGTSARELGDDLVRARIIRRKPSAGEPGLALEDPEKRTAIQRAHDAIAPMYWGPRLSLEEARAIIQGWLRENGWP